MSVLDTTLLIDRSRRRPNAIAKVESLQEQAALLRVPATCWVEFLHYLPPGPREKARATLEQATRFEPFDRVLADEAARLQHELGRVGKRLGLADLQVATTALHYDEPLVSNDRAFDQVPGLLREGY